MTKLSRYRLIEWSEKSTGEGVVMTRMYSKEYRAYQFDQGRPEDWPGYEVLEAPDRATGTLWVKKGIPKAVLRSLSEGDQSSEWHRSVKRVGVFGQASTRIKSSVSSMSSNYIPPTYGAGHDPYEDREFPEQGRSDFYRLPRPLLTQLKIPPHVRIALVLARHSTMRRLDKLKLGKKYWEEAGIKGRSARVRAINALERLGFIQVERRPGKSPTVILCRDKSGELTSWISVAHQPRR